MIIHVDGQGFVSWETQRVRCALGRNGLAVDKREGDGVTPIGSFPLRRFFYRSDRLGEPNTRLSGRALTPEDGWSDDPDDPAYNRLVTLPHPWRHEVLWREDPLYDVIVVLGYNDAPVRQGAGSAIFLHVARPDYAPTEGCVALALEDLLALLKICAPGDCLEVTA
ncbi:L,D-transpeptidase family protein [Magnetospira thiophila]